MTEGPNTPPTGGPQGSDPHGYNPPPGGPQGGPPPGQPPPPGGPGGPPPPAPYAPQAGAGIGQPADLTTRLLARLIDSVIIWVVASFVVATLIVGALFSTGGGMVNAGFNGPGLISSVITAALFVGYFAFLESNRGQTLGKMMMKIQVQGPDGQHPSLEQAFKRNAWMALSIIPVVGGLLQLAAAIYIIVTINNNVTTRQGWHDEFADGTRVIRLG